MKKATITTVLQGCKGPQGRTRLAVLIGGVAMLLLLLSELMPTGTEPTVVRTAPQEIAAYQTQLENRLETLIAQMDGAGKTTLISLTKKYLEDGGGNDLCTGYAVRADAGTADACSAGRWLRPGRDDLSAADPRRGRAVRRRGRCPRGSTHHGDGGSAAGSAIQPDLCGTAQAMI